MADLATVTMSIRRRLHDSTDGSPLYADVFYTDALNRALGRLNLDLNTTYLITTLPSKFDYLLEKRGTIEMCYVRAGEGASSDVSDQAALPVQALTVPNLTIAQVAGQMEGPSYWKKLAQLLESEYAQAMNSIEMTEGVASQAIQQGVISRMSLRTGRRTQYVYDTALEATTASVSVSGSAVTVTWAPVYDLHFGFYEIQRSNDAAFPTGYTVVQQQGDNHTVTLDDSPGVGVWYYRVAVVNDNTLRANSAVVTATVV